MSRSSLHVRLRPRANAVGPVAVKITYFLKDVTAHGGMERVLANKCNALAEAGHEVHIVSIGSTAGRPTFFAFHPGIRMWSLDCEHLYRKGLSARLRARARRRQFLDAAARVLAQIGSDIVVSMFDTWSRHVHAVAGGSATLLELHFAKHKSAQYLYGLERIPLLRGLLRLYKHADYALIARYDRFVVLTEEDRQAWGALDNIAVIPNAQSFPNGPRAALDGTRVLALGRNTRQKRFDLLVRAWARIAARHPGSRLHIVGPGDKTGLARLAARLGVSGSVALEGATDDVRDVLLGGSVLALSSRYEGFGMVLIEAMTCGVPVVAFDCHSGPRDIIADGEDGFLVDSGDVTQLAERLDRLLGDAPLRQAMGDAAYRNVQRFSSAAVMARWQALFDGMLRARGARPLTPPAAPPCPSAE